ncbi:hypothetical protein BC941DRAFT_442086 [Chlamydoabsidia padenii]|nr:hypothetical protein BC941DRAFT_442086 [Chlamydoabsidia padenii]
MPSKTMQVHTLKWALPKKPSYRIQKQQPQPSLTRSTPQMERLASELAFTNDTLATISVHFNSLLLAYTSSQADLNKHYCATRLGPKEKELLAAYDDLGLQVVHLERKIKVLESRLQELRSEKQLVLMPTTLLAL